MSKIEMKQVFCTKNTKSLRLIRDFIREDLNVSIYQSDLILGNNVIMVPRHLHASTILSGQKFLIDNSINDVEWINFYNKIRPLGYFDMGYGFLGNIREYKILNQLLPFELENFFSDLKFYLNSDINKCYDSSDNTFCISVRGLNYYKNKKIFDQYITNLEASPFKEIYDSELNGEYTKRLKLKNTSK